MLLCVVVVGDAATLDRMASSDNALLLGGDEADMKGNTLQGYVGCECAKACD